MLKITYPIYWFVYVAYRKAVYLAAKLSSSD